MSHLKAGDRGEFMNIGQAAKRSNLSAKTIRYYEDIGLVVPHRHPGNDYRTYTDAEVEQLSFLQRARAAGFGLEECRELLELFRNPQRQAADVKQLVVEKLRQLDEQLAVLQAMRETLAGMVEKCTGDHTSHCAIIEKLAGNEEPKKTSMPFTLIEASHD